MQSAFPDLADWSRIRCQVIPRGFRFPFHGAIESIEHGAVTVRIDDMAYSPAIDFSGAKFLHPAAHRVACIQAQRVGSSGDDRTGATLRLRVGPGTLDRLADAIAAMPPPLDGHSRHGFTSLVTYRFARTEADRHDAVVARTLAYRHAGKYRGLDLMQDAFDAEADVLAIYLGGRVIGSLRILQHSGGGSWEHDPFADWSMLPPKHESVEISRASVLPEYQHKALSIGLIQRAILHTIRCGKQHMISCSSDKLYDMYAAIGCEFVGQRFTHPDLGGEPHTMMYKRLVHSLTTCNPPPAWALLWADVYQVLALEHAVGLGTPVDLLKRKVMTLARPLMVGAERLRHWHAKPSVGAHAASIRTTGH